LNWRRRHGPPATATRQNDDQNQTNAYRKWNQQFWFHSG